MSDFTITRGDDPIFDLVLATASGAADLAGVDLWFTAKENAYDADIDSVIQKTIGSGITVVNESEGIVTIEISHADTQSIRARYLGIALPWDVQLRDAIGNIQTVATGTLTIDPDITHST